MMNMILRKIMITFKTDLDLTGHHQRVGLRDLRKRKLKKTITRKNSKSTMRRASKRSCGNCFTR